jgi:type IV pilus assembly protein PilC
MTRHEFQFRALDTQQQIISGQTQASSLLELEQSLQSQGLELLSARHAKIPARISPSELIDLFTHLENLLSAGIPLIDSLDDLSQQREAPTLQQLCQRLAQALRGGQAFSDALLNACPHIAPTIIGVIRAGESSGQLPAVLSRLTHNLQQAQNLKANLHRALLYPAVAGLLVVSASLFLMLFLVPQIREFVLQTGLPQSLPTRMLFALTEQLSRHWPILLALPPALMVMVFCALRYQPSLRLQADRWLFRLPVLGAIQQKLTLAKLADLLALLYSTGIPLLDGLRAMTQVSSNQFIRQTMAAVHSDVEQGQPLSHAFARHPIFPPLWIRMLQVGEKTGALDHSLIHVAQRYEREAEAALSTMQKLIEPALTVVIGVQLGWIMLATMQPIYGLIGQLAP